MSAYKGIRQDALLKLMMKLLEAVEGIRVI